MARERHQNREQPKVFCDNLTPSESSSQSMGVELMQDLKQLWRITGRLTGLALTGIFWYLVLIGTIAILEALTSF